MNERVVSKRSLQDRLIMEGHLQDEVLFQVARDLFRGAEIDLDEIPVGPHLVDLIPLERALYHGVLPVRKEADVLALAMSDPTDILAQDEIRFMTNMSVKPVLCRQGQIAEYINKYYEAENTVQEILKNTLDDAQIKEVAEGSAIGDEAVDLAQLRGDNSSFVRFVNKIIYDAVEARASDIHIEPQGENVQVRYRIDGYLKSIIKVPRDLQHRLAARIKLLAKLDIAEQRKAQDGRIKIVIDGKKIDLRISVIPVFYGEKIVLRILDSATAQFDLDRLGLQPDELAVFQSAIQKPQGVVLVTGPTGSGKTTTLYAALQHIKCETKNIVTIEDPIEYLIDGLNQLQLSRFKDVTFATGLRSILRQDPDVILVGEIRDRETAEIAFRASLTGHLVFSTLHTNSSVASITRLKDIGIEPYLIASSISLFVAQRLIRLVCPNCCEEELPEDGLLMKFQSYLEDVSIRRFYRGKGCEQCNHSGFYGRTSIFEILQVDENIRENIHHNASEGAIFKEAVANGMRTLAESGILKVAEGLTTLEEVSRVVDIIEVNANTYAFS
jgi:type IV pilus assembly protein PilB